MKPRSFICLLGVLFLGLSSVHVFAKTSIEYEEDFDNYIAKYKEKFKPNYLEDARKKGDSWIKACPESVRAYLRRGELYYLHNYTDDKYGSWTAKADWDRAYTMDPKECAAYWKKNSTNTEAASRAWNHFLSTSDFKEAHALKPSETLTKLWESKTFSTAYGLDPDKTSSYLFENGLWDDAALLDETKTIDYLARTKESDATFVKAHEWLDKRYRVKGDLISVLKETQVLWEQDKTSDSKKRSYVSTLIECAQAEKDQSKADLYIKKAYEVDPSGMPEILRKVVAQPSPPPAAYYYLAKISADNEDWAEALKWIVPKTTLNPRDAEALFLHGQALLFTGDFRQALNKFEALAQKTDRETIYHRAFAFYRMGEYRRCLDETAQLVDTDFTHQEYYLKGKCLLEEAKTHVLAGSDTEAKSDYQSAEEVLSSACEQYKQSTTPPNAEILAEYEDALGEARMNLAPSGATLELLRLAMVGDPTYAPAYYHRGENHLRLREPNEAVIDLATAVAMIRNQTTEDKANYTGQHRRRCARGYLERLSKDLPDVSCSLGKAYLYLAVDAERKGLSDKKTAYVGNALKSLYDCIDLKPAHCEGHLYYGYALNMAGKSKEALTEFEKARAWAPAEFEARYAEAWMKEILLDAQAAAVSYGDCFDLISAKSAPDAPLNIRKMCGMFLPLESIDPRFSKGRLLFELAEKENADPTRRSAFYKQAGEVLDEALTRFRDQDVRKAVMSALANGKEMPEDQCALKLQQLLGDAAWRRGVCHRETGDFAGCLTALQEAIEIDNGNDRILSELARSLIEQGTEKDLPQARERAQRAIEINPTDPRNHLHLAWAYYRMKMFQDAISEANQAISLEKTKAFPLSRVIEANAHIERAAELIRAYEKMEPAMDSVAGYEDLGSAQFLKEIEQFPQKRN